jgi:hypothetical protein
MLLQLLTTISYVDNFIDPFPFLPLASHKIPLLSHALFAGRYCLVHSIYGLGWGFGRLAGYKEWRDEWTPKDVWGVAKRGPLPRWSAVKVE